MNKDRARAKAAQYLAWADANERKARELRDSFEREFKDFDWTQPILIGHHSQRRHERVYERRQRMHERESEFYSKATRMREKAENLMRFAERNAGDAEAKRAELRAEADEQYGVGSPIKDPVFGLGIVRRVNIKTYTVQFSPTFTCTRDKSYFVKRH